MAILVVPLNYEEKRYLWVCAQAYGLIRSEYARVMVSGLLEEYTPQTQLPNPPSDSEPLTTFKFNLPEEVLDELKTVAKLNNLGTANYCRYLLCNRKLPNAT